MYTTKVKSDGTIDRDRVEWDVFRGGRIRWIPGHRRSTQASAWTLLFDLRWLTSDQDEASFGGAYQHLTEKLDVSAPL